MRNDTKFIKGILVLSLLGILVSGWLLSLHLKFTSGQASLTESCSILPGGSGQDSQGCESIAVSDFSKPLGIPLPSIAMAFYFTILFLAFWAWRNPQTCYEPLHVAFSMSTLSIPITVLMFLISKYKVGSFCVGCSILWLVNLSLWPCFVKHLGLNWGNALEANLEIFRPKKLNLLRSRVLAGYGLGAACMIILCATGAIASGMQSEGSMQGDIDRAVLEYKNAKILFLPAEAYEGSRVISPKDAKSKPVLDIVAFSDFQCPACRMAARFFKPFILKFGSKVRFSYHSFPLDGACNPYVPNGMHQFACIAARASLCAAEQGKFFAFHDLMFDSQETLNASTPEEVAKEIGLDIDKYQACLKDTKIESALQKDMQWGELIELESTPTLMINGRKLAGAMSPSQLEALLKFVETQK